MDMLSSAPKDEGRLATNVDTTPRVEPRYASTDEMRSEFGSYRVNIKTDKLCDSAAPYAISDGMATNDPYTLDASNEIDG